MVTNVARSNMYVDVRLENVAQLKQSALCTLNAKDFDEFRFYKFEFNLSYMTIGTHRNGNELKQSRFEISLAIVSIFIIRIIIRPIISIITLTFTFALPREILDKRVDKPKN